MNFKRFVLRPHASSNVDRERDTDVVRAFLDHREKPFGNANPLPVLESVMSANVIAFPAAQRRTQVQSAVKMLNETHGAAANQAWKLLIHKMSDEFVAMGLSSGETRRQVLEFQAAVQLELRAQSEPDAFSPRCS